MPIELERSILDSNGGAGDDGEEELNPVAHAKLIDSINSQTGSHYIRDVTRTEPSLKRSEFGLAKTKRDKVHLSDLTKFFTKTKKHSDVVKQLDTLKKRFPLDKPLEKPVADRLKRKAGFERVQQDLDKWEPMVKATDVAVQTVFPLRYGELAVHKEPPKKLSEYRVKTKLMAAIEDMEMEYAGPAENGDDESDGEGRKYNLTVEELRQQQQERAHQKRLESYQIAKGRRVNKIKSKKYHRLLKKDKLKEQMKKFEELKEKDPEEALRQLDQIEKQRFEERATLRHKNTGTWAKNLQVRAKYNMEVRRELADQLSIGRELTAKRLQEEDGSSGDSEGELEPVVGPKNPWVDRGEHEQAAMEQTKLTSGYRKYWDERNRVQALKKQLAEEPQNENAANEKQTNGRSIQNQSSEEDDEIVRTTPPQLTKKGQKKGSETVRMASGSWDVEDNDPPVGEPERNVVKPKPKSKKKQKKVVASVEEMFQEAEELIQDVLDNKLVRVQQKLQEREERDANIGNEREKQAPDGKRRSNPNDLSFKKKARLADADEELNETIDNTAMESKRPSNNETNGGSGMVSKATAEINLNQVVKMKPKHLLTALPDAVTAGELSEGEPEDEVDQRRLTIAEAFEDDDIVADFAKEKRDEREKNLPKEVDLSLPGWGHWAGPGVAPFKPRQNARTLFKPPKELPRRDDNRDQVIINEDALVNPQLAKHLVNELPFPYVTVKDYESSLRAPLGRAFIPETAHVTMIEPRILTKQGAVIEPMKKEMLLENPKGIRQFTRNKTGRDAVEKYNSFVEKFEQENVKKVPRRKF